MSEKFFRRMRRIGYGLGAVCACIAAWLFAYSWRDVQFADLALMGAQIYLYLAVLSALSTPFIWRLSRGQ